MIVFYFFNYHHQLFLRICSLNMWTKKNWALKMSSIEKHKFIRSARSYLSGFLNSVSSNFNQPNQNGNSILDPMLNSARNGILDIIIQWNILKKNIKIIFFLNHFVPLRKWIPSAFLTTGIPYPSKLGTRQQFMGMG